MGMPEIRDQHRFEQILRDRFGEARAHALLDGYRENFITPRDFEIIRSFGMNVVRVPFHYSLLESPAEPGTLRPAAFRWLDRAVQMAQDADMRVLLDLHGAPGGQSTDHTTGRSDRNRLWSSPDCLDRTVWLWEEITAHYRGEPAIAGFDLLNEPFGDYRTPAHLSSLQRLMKRLTRSVHAIDPDRLVFIAGPQQGVEIYGTPDWLTAGPTAFTEHYYPGLHGSAPTLETHARFLSRTLPRKLAHCRRAGLSMLVGEYNVVRRTLAAPVLTRQYVDRFRSYGWGSTLWSYKRLHPEGGPGIDGWSMAWNRDPLPNIDLRTSSYADIQSFFASLSTHPLAINTPLRRAFTNAAPDRIALTEYPPLLRSPPASEPVPPWQSADIGEARAGGQIAPEAASMVIYGGGRDIWGRADQFRFLYQPVDPAGGRLSARVHDLFETHRFAKAGLMLRRDLSPGSPHVLLHVFPDGRLLAGYRDSAGEAMQEHAIEITGLPVYLRLEWNGGRLAMHVSNNGTRWRAAGARSIPWDASSSLYAGPAVCARDENRSLTTARFDEIELLGPAPNGETR